jgi:ABC-2 type transport system ATP-binding protein
VTQITRSSEPAISFSGVTKRYRSVVALDQVSFSVAPGDMVALLGPNGAGKSTTVDVLLGLRQPDSGTARVLGQTPRQATNSGRVGAMLQSGSLPDLALVGEVVELARKLYRSPHSQDELLELAGLTALAHRRADRLSGGQARRVQLAVALAGDPDVLFLDEPTTGLDIQSRRQFWDGVRGAAASGTTVLFATHYLEEADANASRVLVLAGGHLVADGDPVAIKTHLTERTIRATMHPARIGDLQALPGVFAASVDGAEVELHTSDPDGTLDGMYHSDAQVRNLRIDGGGLEEAIIQLTVPPTSTIPGSIS